MYKTIKFIDFYGAFSNIRPDNFTLEGLHALWGHLQDFEKATGTALELDVIALCEEFSEYASNEEYVDDYPDENTDDHIDDWAAARTSTGGYIIYSH